MCDRLTVCLSVCPPQRKELLYTRLIQHSWLAVITQSQCFSPCLSNVPLSVYQMFSVYSMFLSVYLMFSVYTMFLSLCIICSLSVQSSSLCLSNVPLSIYLHNWICLPLPGSVCLLNIIIVTLCMSKLIFHFPAYILFHLFASLCKHCLRLCLSVCLPVGLSACHFNSSIPILRVRLAIGCPIRLFPALIYPCYYL